MEGPEPYLLGGMDNIRTDFIDKKNLFCYDYCNKMYAIKNEEKLKAQ